MELSLKARALLSPAFPPQPSLHGNTHFSSLERAKPKLLPARTQPHAHVFCCCCYPKSCPLAKKGSDRGCGHAVGWEDGATNRRAMPDRKPSHGSSCSPPPPGHRNKGTEDRQAALAGGLSVRKWLPLRWEASNAERSRALRPAGNRCSPVLSVEDHDPTPVPAHPPQDNPHRAGGVSGAQVGAVPAEGLRTDLHTERRRQAG